MNEMNQERFSLQGPNKSSSGFKNKDMLPNKAKLPKGSHVMVKVQSPPDFGGPMLVYDKNKTFVLQFSPKMGPNGVYKGVWDFIHQKGLVIASGAAKIYCDADILTTGELVLFIDVAHKAQW